ncbi:hypothetical protein YPPY25_3373, partial [Yersinia pestis PY-25]
MICSLVFKLCFSI